MAIWAVSLSTVKLSPHSLTLELLTTGIRSLIESGTEKPPNSHPVLYHQQEHSRLALKLFRGEPAITEFDQHFTSIHNSSPHVARCVGSDLPLILLKVHPGHGQLTQFRVLYVPPSRRLRLGFPVPSDHRSLSKRHTQTRRLILQQEHSHPTSGLLLFVSIWFQILFHRPPGLLFTFPSRYWFTIDH